MEVTWAQDPSGPITSQAQNYSQKPLVMAAEDGNLSETDGHWDVCLTELRLGTQKPV